MMFAVLMIGLAGVGLVLSGLLDGHREEPRMVRFQPAVDDPRVLARTYSRGTYESAAGDELMGEIEDWLRRQR